MGRLRRSLVLSLPLVLLALLAPRKAHAKKPTTASSRRSIVPSNAIGRSKRDRELHIQTVVDRVRAELSVVDPVSVAIVDENRLIVSVARADDRAQGFELALEDGFVSQLSDEELEAVVAHELGHVWIFTHHPYLQTEELANTVALQLVERTTLENVYDKVWSRVGTRGRLTYLPGGEQ